MNAESDYTMRELVHGDQYPVRIEQDRFAAQEVGTPQAILRVTGEGEPRGFHSARRRTVVFGKDAPHDVLVDHDAECPRDDQPSPWAAERRLARFQLDNCAYEFVAGPYGPGFLGRWLNENNRRYFPRTNASCNLQQSRWPQDDGKFVDTFALQKQRTEAERKTVQR
jgi:hypothetical protein